MESKLVLTVCILLGLFITYLVMLRIFNYINKKFEAPYNINDNNLSGFGWWRNKMIFLIIIIVIIISFLIILIEYIWKE